MASALDKITSIFYIQSVFLDLEYANDKVKKINFIRFFCACIQWTAGYFLCIDFINI